VIGAEKKLKSLRFLRPFGELGFLFITCIFVDPAGWILKKKGFRMKEIDVKIRGMYAFLTGYYQGICFKKINDMYSLSEQELSDLYDQIREKAIEMYKGDFEKDGTKPKRKNHIH